MAGAAGPMLVGGLGSAVVVAGVLALRTILRPDSGSAPPSDEPTVARFSDPALGSLFGELRLLVSVVAVGAGLVGAALVWGISAA